MWYEQWHAPGYTLKEASISFLCNFPFDAWDALSAQCQFSSGSHVSFKMCLLAFQNLYIMSEVGPYLWQSLHFWQMGAMIKAWSSPLLNHNEVESICSGMSWLAFFCRGMRSRCLVCLLLKRQRALQLAHVGILWLTHSKSLIISYSKIEENAKTSQQIGRNLTAPLPTIMWDLFLLPSIRSCDPAGWFGFNIHDYLSLFSAFLIEYVIKIWMVDGLSLIICSMEMSYFSCSILHLKIKLSFGGGGGVIFVYCINWLQHPVVAVRQRAIYTVWHYSNNNGRIIKGHFSLKKAILMRMATWNWGQIKVRMCH